MFCNNCGIQLPDGSKFCHECGEKTVVEIQPNAQETSKGTAGMFDTEQQRSDVVTTANGIIIDLQKIFGIYGKNKLGFSSYLSSKFDVSRKEAKDITNAFMERHKDDKSPNIFARAKNQAVNDFKTNYSTEMEYYEQTTDTLSRDEPKVKICPKCGEMLDERAEFCPTCKTNAKKVASISKSDTNAVETQKASATNPNLQFTPSWQQITPAKKSKRQITKERIKENKANAVACCPKCGSTSLSANKKGFGVGKAALGIATGVGLIGAVAGNIGAKKVWVTCLNCGNRWKM